MANDICNCKSRSADFRFLGKLLLSIGVIGFLALLISGLLIWAVYLLFIPIPVLFLWQGIRLHREQSNTTKSTTLWLWLGLLYEFLIGIAVMARIFFVTVSVRPWETGLEPYPQKLTGGFGQFLVILLTTNLAFNIIITFLLSRLHDNSATDDYPENQ